MSTVDDAIEAGARALLAAMPRYEYPGEDREHEWAARQVLPAARAMWPVLSAGLRSKAELHAIAAHARGSEEERHWLDMLHLMDRIDKEMGNDDRG